jgi:methane/ammonia monooxygenase subunit A
MLRDKSIKTGAAPATESISASPGIEGGAGATPVFMAHGAAGAVAGSPFNSRAEAATSVRQADLLILTFLFLIMIGPTA